MTWLIIKTILPLLVILQLVPLLIWIERKGAAFIQDRPGPNRASIKGVRLGGIIHSLADVLKLFFKEDIIPANVNRPFYLMAPMAALFVACVTFLVIPYADSTGTVFSFQSADLGVGILYILAVSSLGVYGVMLAGWSSNNKFALLGGVRSSAQMVSYELSMGLAIVSVVLTTGSLKLSQIVVSQSASMLHWNFILQPVAAIIFIISSFAETNRAPFDLPEGESELVAGYHVEYSSMKFAMFFMAEYIHMVIASAMIATLFFGGWQIPFVSTETLRANADVWLYRGILGFAVVSLVIGIALVSKFKRKLGDKRDFEVLVFGIPAILTAVAAVVLAQFLSPIMLPETGKIAFAAALQIGCFLAKILFFCWVFVWVRWTLPRFRYDQLMNLGWKYLLPIAMVNVAVTAVVLLFV